MNTQHLLVLTSMLLALSFGVSNIDAYTERAVMQNDLPGLVGVWHKQSGNPCVEQYPARLRIESGGLYFGDTDPPGAFVWWDGGTWRVPAPGRLALSVANDAVIEYAFTLDGERLVITDQTGCDVIYERAP